MGIFSGDAYKAGKSTWELGLITTGAWLGVSLWKKWLKQILRVTWNESVKELTSAAVKSVQSKVKNIVSEVSVPISVVTKGIDDIPTREIGKTPIHIERKALADIPFHPKFSGIQNLYEKPFEILLILP